MNKWIWRGIKFSLFLVAFNTLEHFCHKKTEGFSLQRIQFHGEPIISSTEISPSCLTQPFHYYSHGNQCFAFISEDGQYILKFFKYVHHNSPAWTSKFFPLNRFKPFRQKKIEKIAWKRTRDFQGYQIAFDHFRTETGLLALHLHPTEKIYPTITLYDKLKIAHSIDLNNTPFILQKRAIPIYEQFSAWIESGNIEKIKQGITGLVSLCVQRTSKNIFDDDVHFYSNFGFVGETPIQIDPGHFVLTSSCPTNFPVLELKDWFAKHYSPLVSYVEACAP